MKKNSLMVIDDDSDIRNSVKDLMEINGYDVLLAENGKTGLELLKSLPEEELPSLIFLDLMMPVMDGSKFMEIINNDHVSTLAKIPIVVASAKGQMTQTFIGENVHVLRKPFDVEHLMDLVEKYCR